jgi:hypothetical protein
MSDTACAVKRKPDSRAMSFVVDSTLTGHKDSVLHLDHRHDLSRLASASEVRQSKARTVREF